jgi:hypothetical protein
MLGDPATPTSAVKTAEFVSFFGTAEEAAEKHQKAFLQGLKPIRFGCFTPGLKPQPPKEKTFCRKL